MSFTSTGTVTVPRSLDRCYDILCNHDLFVEFMNLSDITRNVEILKTDRVRLSQDMQVVPYDESESGSDEVCTRLHFKLTEIVKYLGVTKEIPVVGHITISGQRKIHVEHREASAGLVITDKVRTFEPVTDIPDDAAQDHARADAGPNTADSTSESSPATMITEDIKGQTSWYLRYFVEMEARRSHQSTMAQYAVFVQRHSK